VMMRGKSGLIIIGDLAVVWYVSRKKNCGTLLYVRNFVGILALLNKYQIN
jgi:hypothetical protein